MTRASLLHVLDPGTALGPAQVRELEALALAFPYCQTAHLLLAKAAHDQGAMLAGQRLRRAATYAADRALLRRLIETAPPVPAEAAPVVADVPAASLLPEPTAAQPGRFVAQRPGAEAGPATAAAALPVAATAAASTAPLETVAPALAVTPALAGAGAGADAPAPAIAGLAGAVVEIEANEPLETPAHMAGTAVPTGAGTTPDAAPGRATATAAALPAPAAPATAGAAPATTWAVSTTAALRRDETAAPATPAASNTPTAPPAAAGAEAVRPLIDANAAAGQGLTLATGSPADNLLIGNPPLEMAAAGSSAAEKTTSLDFAAPETAAALPGAAAAEPLAASPGAAPASVAPDTAAAPASEPTSRTTARMEVAAAATPATAAAPVLEPAAQTVTESANLAAPTEAPAPLAPPVRPPLEAGAARFEYGLADTLDPTPAYLLPGLTDEWTWTLPPKPFVPPGLTPAAFLGDDTLGYGWGESTRMGLALMPLAADEILVAEIVATDDAAIADEAPAPGTTPAIVAPLAFALPLPDTFFAPDALLLAHWAAHRPAALPPPTSLQLIDTFLRQKPRLTRPALAKTSTETPADLAAPSTHAPPELVSESLARILARQGKLARAIEVYERLMVKHPEKIAYFATEIQSLKLQQPPLA